MRDSSTCNVVCLSPGQTYKLSHGCSRHGIPVMRLPEACHVVDFWYSLLSLSIIRTAPRTIPRVIQAWYIYHKTARSVQSGKLLLIHRSACHLPWSVCHVQSSACHAKTSRSHIGLPVNHHDLYVMHEGVCLSCEESVCHAP